MNKKKELIDHRDELEKQLLSVDSVIENLDLQIKTSVSSSAEREFKEELDKYENLQSEIRADLDQVRAEIDQVKMFDRERCIENITLLLDLKGKKLGSIERLSGNAVGYLSRMRSGKSNADPNIEFLLTAASELDVSLDMLVVSEIKEMTQTEEYLLKFLDKLALDTRADNVTWLRERLSELDKVEVEFSYDGEPYADHPFFTIDVVNEGDHNSYRAVYDSQFFKRSGVKLSGDCYNAKLPNSDSSLYIMSCSKGDNSIAWKCEKFYELYMRAGDGLVSPICNTMDVCSPIMTAVDNLVKEVKLSVTHVHMDNQVKKAIDEYLGVRVPKPDSFMDIDE